jgi:quinol monooxygenase YgiN
MAREHKDVGNIAVCRFVVKEGREEAFERLLARHYPTLDRLGLVEREPHLVLRGKDEEGRTFYVEILPWKDDAAVARAHELPEVGAVWEPMEPLCEHMEFPHAERLAL